MSMGKICWIYENSGRFALFSIIEIHYSTVNGEKYVTNVLFSPEMINVIRTKEPCLSLNRTCSCCRTEIVPFGHQKFQFFLATLSSKGPFIMNGEILSVIGT